MTAVVNRAGGGPQTHALVIGVDTYPHCGPSSQRTGEEWRLVADVRPVSCATPSAMAVAGWLAGPVAAAGTPAPVGTVELLVSNGTDVTFGQGDDAVAVEAATFMNAEAAYRRWRERCGRRSDNIALLYFCGHGLNIGGRDLLLLGDFGAPGALFRNALDFSGTHLAMQHCKADIQCYFIDACRTVPDHLVATLGHAGQRFDEPMPPLPPRDNPIIYSTAPGETSYAPDGVATPFAQAVVHALDGLAAEHQLRWEIRTHRLVQAVRMVMDWNERGGARGQVPTPGGVSRNGLIRTLPAAPLVPFELGLDPHAALGRASLRLVGRRERLDRAPTTAPWCGTAAAGSYEYGAEFTDTGPFHPGADDVAILAPYRRFNLPVEQR